MFTTVDLDKFIVKSRTMPDPKPRRNLPLTDQQRAELLDRLDGKHDAERTVEPIRRGQNRRADDRAEYRLHDVAITVEHLGGGAGHLIVCGRNLSAGGFGFVHGGFLHPGSACRLRLMRLDGQSEQVAGRIVSCRHVEGVVHEVGVQFETRIDPSAFVSISTSEPEAPTESIEAPQLNERVLYIESSTAETRLLTHYLTPTGARLTTVATPGAGLDAVKRERFDIVVTELNLDGEDGVEAIRKIRAVKFAGPIVVLTAETDPVRHNDARAAGADRSLTKPYSVTHLYAEMRTAHQMVLGTTSSAAMRSTLEGDTSMAHLIDSYIQEAKDLAERLDKAMEESQFDAVRRLCLNIKGSAPSYGFESLGDIASVTLEGLDGPAGLDGCSSQVRRLSLMCRCLTSDSDRRSV